VNFSFAARPSSYTLHRRTFAHADAPDVSSEQSLDLSYCGVVVKLMNVTELTPQQLRRAASIKEQLDSLNKELRSLLGSLSNRTVPRKKRTMSAAARKKVAARSGRDG